MANPKAKEFMNAVVTAMMVVILVVISALIIATITSNSIFNDLTTSGTINNETGGFINSSGYTLAQATASGFTSPSITSVINATSGTIVAAGNYTISGVGVLTNASSELWTDVNVSYTYTYSTDTNLAGVNVTSISESFGDFVTNLIAFLAVIGTIVGVVWLVMYVKKLFEKKTGLNDITA